MKRICEFCKKEYDWVEGQINWGKNGIKSGKGSVDCKKYCCYKCGKEAYKENCKRTNQIRYGVDNPFQAEIFKEKSRLTCLEKYGVENSMKSKKIQQKSQETCLKNYGVRFTAQSKICSEKRRKTCEEKYGGPAPACNKEIKQKAKNTWLKVYGTDNPMKLESTVQKIKQTCLEKYGADHILKTKVGKNKLKQTCKIRYGAPSNLCLYSGVKPKNSSKKEIDWIKSLNISTMDSHKVIKVDKYKWVIVDGFDVATNTVYEFLGDYFHGNPEVFNPNKINKTMHKRMKTLYKETFDRFDLIKGLGYNIVYIWENDYKQHKNPKTYQ